MEEIECVSFKMDIKNKGKLIKLAENSGLKLGTYMRFEALKIIEKNESVNA